MLEFFCHNFGKAMSSLKLLLYKSLARPKVEHTAAIWDPCYATLEQNLELVRNNASRLILSNYYFTGSAARMTYLLCLPRLSLRRNLFRLCLFIRFIIIPLGESNQSSCPLVDLYVSALITKLGIHFVRRMRFVTNSYLLIFFARPCLHLCNAIFL